MNRKLLVASIALISIAVVGCKREAPAPTSESITPAATTDLAAAGVQPGAIADKAFAGTFKGTLPCADCPGIDETLELKPDGSFALTDVYRDRPQGTNTIAGSWTSEDNNKRIRLDPNTKAEEDHLFAILSHDAVSALGKDGKHASGPALHRRP